MSRAFVRETDFPRPDDVPQSVSPLPPGAKNLITPAGAQRLREELARLTDTARPKLAAAPNEDVDAKRELMALDQRIRYLKQSLLSADIVNPADGPRDVVRFGATVKVREEGGAESTYRIVGVDEIDPERGHVSWLSPIARALLNARVGQRVTFKAPRGLKQLEILAIDYSA